MPVETPNAPRNAFRDRSPKPAHPAAKKLRRKDKAKHTPTTVTLLLYVNSCSHGIGLLLTSDIEQFKMPAMKRRHRKDNIEPALLQLQDDSCSRGGDLILMRRAALPRSP